MNHEVIMRVYISGRRLTVTISCGVPEFGVTQDLVLVTNIRFNVSCDWYLLLET